MSDGPLRLATRGSTLARTQADRVAEALAVPVEIIEVSTTGDQRADVPIWQMGGRGVFVKEVQIAVLEGRADAAVHSAKDLPSETPDGLALAAFPERADPRDALAGTALADLPTGAVVATGSVRRRAQLAWLRPDIVFAPLRGNVPTRLEKGRQHDAAVLSYAAMLRLDLGDEATEVLDPSVMLPQVGQGALAVECRADDERAREAVAAIDDPEVRRAVLAERAFLAELGGGCNLPVGAYAEPAGDVVSLEVLIASLDGRRLLRHRAAGADPEATGREAARELLDELGGRALLGTPDEPVAGSLPASS